MALLALALGFFGGVLAGSLIAMYLMAYAEAHSCPHCRRYHEKFCVPSGLAKE